MLARAASKPLPQHRLRRGEACDSCVPAKGERRENTKLTTDELRAVRAFEHAGWERAAPQYDAAFAPATRGFVEALLDAAEIGCGARVLDLACGPGIAAAAARRRGADPVGADFSQRMLTLARAGDPLLRLAQADAGALPFAPAVFDAVVANFGVHHFPDPVAALHEARRVLRPGGRIAFTSWAAPPENIAWNLLFSAIAAHGDPKAAKTPPSGGGLRRPEDIARVLAASGFAETGVGPVAGEWRLAGSRDLIEGFRRGTVRTAALLAAQPSGVLPAIEATIEAAVARYRRSGAFVVPTLAILGWGVRPPTAIGGR